KALAEHGSPLAKLLKKEVPTGGD
ncbi:MAG: hypothetical protein JWR69_2502, partial [Pedosphaera sp.]|nr:hypothetical protein [Pedosphaera sp.]